MWGGCHGTGRWAARRTRARVYTRIRESKAKVSQMPLLVSMDLVRITRARVCTRVRENKAKVSQMLLLAPGDLVKITDGEGNKSDP